MLQGPRVSSEILAQGADFTMAPQTWGPLSGSIDQSRQGAQMYGLGPWSNSFNDAAPGGWELGSNGQFVPTNGQSGLSGLFQAPRQQQQTSQPQPQWNNGWMRFLSNIVPGQQVPGGGAGQWIRGGVQGLTGLPVATVYDWFKKD